MFKRLSKPPFQLFRYQKLATAWNCQRRLSALSATSVLLHVLTVCLYQLENKFLLRLVKWMSHVPYLQLLLLSFHSLDVRWHVSHPLALGFWVWAESMRKADTSLKHVLKPGTICGLENFCHLVLFVIKVMKWTPVAAFETTLGSVHRSQSSCTASVPRAGSELVVFCNARWWFSSVGVSSDFSLVSLSSPLRGRPCRDPSWCVCEMLSFKCSRTEMQLSLSSVNNRKFNLLGGKS